MTRDEKNRILTSNKVHAGNIHGVTEYLNIMLLLNDEEDKESREVYQRVEVKLKNLLK